MTNHLHRQKSTDFEHEKNDYLKQTGTMKITG